MSKKQTDKKAPKKKPEDESKDPNEIDWGEANDFGGLPDRDLKKNLGCG